MIMTLEQWKQKYPDAQSFYDGFHGSDDGTDAWQRAYEYMNQTDYEEEDEDGLTDSTDLAYDEVDQAMELWVLDDFTSANEKDYEAALAWFESMRDELGEMIYAGLT
jgi:hypothetical protein